MKNQQHGVRSTKIKQTETHNPPPDIQVQTTLPQKAGHFCQGYNTKDTMYTDQTGKFLHVSSRGNKYMMIQDYYYHYIM